MDADLQKNINYLINYNIMKKYFLAILCMFSLNSVFAQNVNTNSSENNGYNRVNIGYNASLISCSITRVDDYIPGALHGFTVGYTRGINLTHKLPLFLEVGAQMIYGGGSKNGLSVKQLRFAVPVNITYRFRINDDFKLSPYTGFALDVNAVERYNLGGYSGSLFDGFNYRGFAGSANRVSGTWQIGLNANYKKFLVGLEYGLDMNNYVNTNDDSLYQAHISQSHVALNFGYEF